MRLAVRNALYGENLMKKKYYLRFFTVFIILISIPYSGCSDDGSHDSIRVRVVTDDGKEIADSTVVLGNPDGSMVSFGTTDATGSICFQNPPINATVTAAVDCQGYSGYSYDYYFLAAAYDVNIPEITLTLYDCSNDFVSGTLNVNVTDGVSGIDYREVTVGGLTYGGDSHSFSLYVGSYFFQSDGKFSVVAVGYDADDNAIGYGLLLDQTFYDGVTVDVTIDSTDIGQIDYFMENIPESATEYILQNPIKRKDADTYVFGVWGDAPVPSSVSLPYILDFGDSYSFIVSLPIDSDRDGSADSRVMVHKKSLTQSNQTFDFSKTPLIPTNLAFSMAKPDCPTISWNGRDASSQFIWLYLSFNISSPVKSYFSYSLVLPPSRTSIIFPELPETLAIFRPSDYKDLDISTYNYDIYSGYADYLKKTDMYYSGIYKEPAESILRFSKTGISKP